jgi:HD-GYP domain-containing protein (c-di-GMP phosphodiesterase class II)
MSLTDCGDALQILQHDRGRHFDPDIVDLFTGMAAELHELYAHRTGQDLKAELIDMSWRYFQTDAEKLV